MSDRYNYERVSEDAIRDIVAIATSSKYGIQIITALLNNMEPNPFVYGMWSAELSYDDFFRLIPDLNNRKNQIYRAMNAAIRSGGLVRLTDYNKGCPYIYTLRSFAETKEVVA